jgi:hypothetical protein
MVAFPMATFIGFVSACVEYWLDKWRLVRFSRRPKNVVAGATNQITILIIWFVIGFQAVLNPGGGGAYLLVSEYFMCGNSYRPQGYIVTRDYCKTKCAIFFGHNTTFTNGSALNPFPTPTNTLSLGWFGKY